MILKTKEDIERQFSDWLYGIGSPIFEFEARKRYNAVIQISKDNDFSYLFLQSCYRGHGISAKCFEFAGILCKKDRKVYDLHWRIAENLSESFEQNGGAASKFTITA
jgi:hypothetical protein